MKMNLNQALYTELKASIQLLFGQSPDGLQVQPTNLEFEGSHTLVCFPLTKLSKKSPEETARLIGDHLVQSGRLISKFNVVKGFLNLSISDAVWLEVLSDVLKTPDYGRQSATSKEIMVEYSSPNTNKPLHLGHLRNNFLGFAVAEIYAALGYKVHKVQIINDRGIHICKSMAAWSLFGNGETPESSGLKGDKLVGKYYVEFDRTYKVQIKEQEVAGMTTHRRGRLRHEALGDTDQRVNDRTRALRRRDLGALDHTTVGREQNGRTLRAAHVQSDAVDTLAHATLLVVIQASATLYTHSLILYSHSIVPGGLLVTSRTNRLTPGTSLMTRFEIRSTTS